MQAGGIDPTRMHRVEHDPGGCEAAGPLVGEDDLSSLGARVGLHTVIPIGGELEAVDVEALGVHAARGDRDHARRGGTFEMWDQQLREEERSEDVRRDCELDSQIGGAELAREHPGVVDEHVKAVMTAGEPRGEAAERIGIREVADRVLHVVVAGSAR